MIKPQFDYASVFGGADRASVAINAKWGFIDRTGKFLIEPKFVGAQSSGLSDSKGLAAVGSDGRSMRNDVGVIDSTGRYVIQPNYSLIQFVPGANDSVLIIIIVTRWCLFGTLCLP